MVRRLLREHDSADEQPEFPGGLIGEAPISPSRQILSDIELDALTELVNIGVSRAANSLRELVGEQVLLLVRRRC